MEVEMPICSKCMKNISLEDINKPICPHCGERLEIDYRAIKINKTKSKEMKPLLPEIEAFIEKEQEAWQELGLLEKWGKMILSDPIAAHLSDLYENALSALICLVKEDHKWFSLYMTQIYKHIIALKSIFEEIEQSKKIKRK